MGRMARIVVPYLPHHIVQRGHHRGEVFFERLDYVNYLSNLGKLKTDLGCRVYAYCLMTNHVHIIVDPGSDVSVLGTLMQRLAGRHTQDVNAVRQWKGTLWEGRFRSSPIDTDRYLLACCRYVEFNPVRAGIVEKPEKYPWSSLSARSGRGDPAWLDDPPVNGWICSPNPPSKADAKLVHDAVQRGRPTGDEVFLKHIEATIGRDISPRAPGRPKVK